MTRIGSSSRRRRVRRVTALIGAAAILVTAVPAVSGGALDPVETTLLLSVDEAMEAMRRAQQVRYRPPGA